MYDFVVEATIVEVVVSVVVCGKGSCGLSGGGKGRSSVFCSMYDVALSGSFAEPQSVMLHPIKCPLSVSLP